MRLPPFSNQGSESLYRAESYGRVTYTLGTIPHQNHTARPRVLRDRKVLCRTGDWTRHCRMGFFRSIWAQEDWLLAVMCRLASSQCSHRTKKLSCLLEEWMYWLAKPSQDGYDTRLSFRLLENQNGRHKVRKTRRLALIRAFPSTLDCRLS